VRKARGMAQGIDTRMTETDELDGDRCRWVRYFGAGRLRDRCQLQHGHPGPCRMCPDDGQVVGRTYQELEHGKR